MMMTMPSSSLFLYDYFSQVTWIPPSSQPAKDKGHIHNALGHLDMANTMKVNSSLHMTNKASWSMLGSMNHTKTAKKLKVFKTLSREMFCWLCALHVTFGLAGKANLYTHGVAYCFKNVAIISISISISIITTTTTTTTNNNNSNDTVEINKINVVVCKFSGSLKDICYVVLLYIFTYGCKVWIIPMRLFITNSLWRISMKDRGTSLQVEMVAYDSFCPLNLKPMLYLTCRFINDLCFIQVQ